MASGLRQKTAWVLTLSLLMVGQGHAQLPSNQTAPWLSSWTYFKDGWDRLGIAVDALLNGDWLRDPSVLKAPQDSQFKSADPQQEPTTKPLNPSAEEPMPAEDVEFDTAFLGGDQKLDLSKFSKSDYVQPGLHRTEVRVNGLQTLTDLVRFEAGPDGSGKPCLTAEQLQRAGILSAKATQAGGCHPVLSLVPGAQFTYDSGEQVLDLSISQAYLRRTRQGMVDSSLWDRGVPVWFSQYSLTGAQTQNSNVNSQSYFGRFDNTFSAHGWQIKNSLIMSQAGQIASSTQTLNSYLRTDLEGLQGEFKMGEIYSSGVLLDAFSFKGVALSSYDEFLSDQDVGYAPVVRGVADTNAVVSITQNGVQIHKINVAPGPFVITDLRGAGYSGTLTVNIIEANGSVKSFLVPYSAQAQMVRKGRFKYAFNGGRYNAPGSPYRPDVAQATVQYGMFSNLTVYGGLTYSSRYNALLEGVAMSTFAGTLAYDLTHSTAQFDEGVQKGARQRWSYSKSVQSTGMFINVTKSQNAGLGYLTFANAATLMGQQTLPSSIGVRGQLTASVTQPFGRYGDVSLSLVQNTYDSAPASNSYGLTWRQTFNGLALSVSATQQLAGSIHSTSTTPVKSVALQLSVPLEKMTYVSSGINFSGGKETTQSTYSQTLGDHKQYGLNLAASTDEQRKTSVSATGSLRSRTGYQSVGMSWNDNYRSLNFGVSGAVALHAEGVTWASQVSDTMALVHAPGAEGAQVNGGTAVIDRNGFALVSNLQPYRVNEVYLDPRGIGQDVELTATSQQAIVRSGAVARLNYTTVTGRGFIMTLERVAGAVPFGAVVTDEHGQEVGAVGQGSRVFLRGVPTQGRLKVSWGDQPEESCEAQYIMPLPEKSKPYDHVSVTCDAVEIQKRQARMVKP